MNDAIPQFRDTIRAAGLEPPDVIEPGKLHRFPGIGKRPSNRAGWCLLFDDGLGGCFGDWSSGVSETWQAKRDKPYSRAERAALPAGWKRQSGDRGGTHSTPGRCRESGRRDLECGYPSP